MNLFDAVLANDLARVSALIRAGVNLDEERVNEDEDDAMTALHLAAISGNVKIGKALLDAGANVNSQNRDGFTRLDIAIESREDQFVSLLLQDKRIELGDALAIASHEGNLDVVKLLLAKGADPNGNPDPNSYLVPIVEAGLSDSIAIIDVLLDNGADVNHPDNETGMTPLMEIIKRGDPLVNEIEVLRRLLEEPNIDIDSQTPNGYTALMYAAGRDNPPVLNLLLEYYPNPNLVDVKGKLALDLADANTRDILEEYTYVTYPALRQTRQLAKREMAKRTILQRRFQTGTNIPPELQLPQRQIPQYIFAKSAYDELCTRLSSYNNKPQIQELARSLGITLGNKSKKTLCTEISRKLIL